MEYISEVYVTETGIRRFTAPSGYIYQIHGVHVASFGSAAVQFMIVDRYVEEEDALIDRSADAFFAVDFAIDGMTSNIVLPEPIESKYISMGPTVNTPVVAFIIIYYTLKKASLTELVWEFVKRGKSP